MAARNDLFPGGPTAPPRYRYDDTTDLIEESLEVLAQRRAKWLGDDLQAVGLLANLIEAAERALADRVRSARANGHAWLEIAETLATTPTEVRLRFESGCPTERTRLSPTVSRSPIG